MTEKLFWTRTKDRRLSQKERWHRPTEFDHMVRIPQRFRLEINFHQPNKIVNTVIQSDTYLQMAAKGGLRENYHQQKQNITEPEAFFPIAKDPQTVRAAQLAILELLKQPEGSDCFVF